MKNLFVFALLACLLNSGQARANPIVTQLGGILLVPEGFQGNIVFSILPGNAFDLAPNSLSLTVVDVNYDFPIFSDNPNPVAPDEEDGISIGGVTGNVNDNSCGYGSGSTGTTNGTIPAGGCIVSVPFESDPFNPFEGDENNDHGLNQVRLTATVTAPGNPVQTGSGLALVDVEDQVPEPDSLILCGTGMVGVATAVLGMCKRPVGRVAQE